MMKTNIVIIDLEKYNELINENQQMKNVNNSLREELMLNKLENMNVNNKIVDIIYKDSSWELKQLLKDKEDSFYISQISNKFEDYGYTSQDYIKDTVKYMIKKYEEENKEENNDSNI